jgi:hypothetical protein
MSGMIPEWIPLIPCHSGIDTGIFHNPWNFAKPGLFITAEIAVSVAKDRENKKKRLKKIHEADKKKEKVKKKTVFRLYTAAALEIEAAKK